MLNVASVTLCFSFVGCTSTYCVANMVTAPYSLTDFVKYVSYIYIFVIFTLCVLCRCWFISSKRNSIFHYRWRRTWLCKGCCQLRCWLVFITVRWHAKAAYDMAQGLSDNTLVLF